MSTPTNSDTGLQASVIIPAYNAAHILPRCLDALERQTLPRTAYEIIVVDDGSLDQTAVIATERGARLLEVGHAGAAAARNAGVEIAHAPIVVFTDADCEPAPDFLERVLEPLADANVSGARGVYRTRQDKLVARFVQIEYEERYQRIAHFDEKFGPSTLWTLLMPLIVARLSWKREDSTPVLPAPPARITNFPSAWLKLATCFDSPHWRLSTIGTSNPSEPTLSARRAWATGRRSSPGSIPAMP